jgi:hypothetical protein
MKLPSVDATGLLLPGGGARAAYQVGALRTIAKLLPRDHAQPFGIINGGRICCRTFSSTANSRALIKVGYDDAMARRDQLVGFLDGASPGYVPLFPRELH